MKVLGISFGRKNQNCDVLVKEALFGAESLGADIPFINMNGKNIQPCKGCFACNTSRMNGGASRCMIKDDMSAIDDAILDADAVIVAAPVYSVGPSGQLKCMIDRMGLPHDIAFSNAINHMRREQGKSEEELLDRRLFKDRFLGLISVGGAMDSSWTAMGLPNMHLLSFSMQMPVIDHYDVYDMNLRVNPVLDEKLMERINLLGRNVTAAIGRPKYEVEWKGDQPGICPACHNDLLIIKGGVKVECPICGMKGTLSIVQGEIQVDFPETELEHSRVQYGGVLDHFKELSTIGERIPEATKARIPSIEEKLKKYKEIPSFL